LALLAASSGTRATQVEDESMVGEITVERLLLAMKQMQASDLHIKVGSPPILRIASRLRQIESKPLWTEDTQQLLGPLVPEHLRRNLEDKGGVDFSHHDEQGDRFRCSVFHAGGGLHAAIRRVNPKIPSFNELHLPAVYEQFTASSHDGLIIICGVTGSGKSSTLAAMIDHINEQRQCNIITIEDPVEYAFKPKLSFISQREIGLDVPDFQLALRAAVRQDPDVIMIGEMRDKQTLLAGIQAAETGHLVYVTLHTADTMQAFTRILEFFPTEEHPFIRSSLANSLRAVAAQRLIPSILPDVQRVPATEVLLNSGIVADRIREGRDEDLPAIIAGGGESGMHDFTSSLLRLVKERSVDLKVAEKYAPNVEVLRSRVRGIDVKSDVLVSKAKR
jgi:twitching motility protein PilT